MWILLCQGLLFGEGTEAGAEDLGAVHDVDEGLGVDAVEVGLELDHVGAVDAVAEEVLKNGKEFKLRPVFDFMIKYLCPFFLAVILFCAVANVLGIISM